MKLLLLLILLLVVVAAAVVILGIYTSRIRCLIKHHAMKTYWESGGIAPGIINLDTN
jgi:hypothetical protein